MSAAESDPRCCSEFAIRSMRARTQGSAIRLRAASRVQRTCASADELRDALFAAGTAFMVSDFATVNEHLRRGTTLYLPTGGGCFVGEMIRGKSKQRVYTYARARTYLTGGILGADQVPLPAAADPENSTLLSLWRSRDASSPETAPRISSRVKPTAPVALGETVVLLAAARW